jgi:hypothetical protein
MARHERAMVDRELLFGQLTSAVVNFSQMRPKDPSKTADFMPSEWIKRSIAKTGRLTDRQRAAIADQVRQVARSFLEQQNGPPRVTRVPR